MFETREQFVAHACSRPQPLAIVTFVSGALDLIWCNFEFPDKFHVLLTKPGRAYYIVLRSRQFTSIVMLDMRFFSIWPGSN